MAQAIKKIHNLDQNFLKQLATGVRIYQTVEDRSERVFNSYLKLFDEKSHFVYERYHPEKQTWSTQQYVSGGVSIQSDSISKINLSKKKETLIKQQPTVTVLLGENSQKFTRQQNSNVWKPYNGAQIINISIFSRRWRA